MQCDHVQVAFDDYCLFAGCNFFVILVEAVQQLPFLEDRCLARVEVLRRAILGLELAPSKAYHVTTQVLDWEDEAAAENIERAVCFTLLQ
ncbi:hypothetical protein D3C77_532350 [compost metagenome]